jgi:hypothetical protein
MLIIHTCDAVPLPCEVAFRAALYLWGIAACIHQLGTRVLRTPTLPPQEAPVNTHWVARSARARLCVRRHHAGCAAISCARLELRVCHLLVRLSSGAMLSGVLQTGTERHSSHRAARVRWSKGAPRTLPVIMSSKMPSAVDAMFSCTGIFASFSKMPSSEATAVLLVVS